MDMWKSLPKSAIPLNTDSTDGHGHDEGGTHDTINGRKENVNLLRIIALMKIVDSDQRFGENHAVEKHTPRNATDKRKSVR